MPPPEHVIHRVRRLERAHDGLGSGSDSDMSRIMPWAYHVPAELIEVLELSQTNVFVGTGRKGGAWGRSRFEVFGYRWRARRSPADRRLVERSTPSQVGVNKRPV